MSRTRFFVLASFILSTLVLWSIRHLGDWYPMHDSTHLARILLMREAWVDGQVPAIWAKHINQGLGYPLFHFYAPLFHTLSTLFLRLLATPTTALKLSLWLTTFLGTLGIMFYAKRWGRTAALVSGFAFALSPYLAVSLYVRGSFSEYLSLALLPWVFLATEQINTRLRVVLAGLSLAFFLLSHNLIPILVLPMLAVWVIYHNYRSLRMVALALFLAISLSAWFVLPLLFERSFTVADQVARTTSYAQHFVEPWQMWNSTWGFGGSTAGVEDGMSFKLGKLQIVLGILGMGIALYRKNRGLTLISFFLVISIWLTTSSSHFLWSASSILQIVQFPWRALGLIAVFLAILSGYSVSRISLKPMRIAMGLGLISAFIFLNLKYFTPQAIIQTPLDEPSFELSQIEDIAPIVPEFMPKWLTQENIKIVGSTTLPYAYYPTWTIKLDGQEVIAYPSVEGKLSFNNPHNSTNYQVQQSHTKLEKLSIFISVLTWLTLVLSLFIPKFYAKK